MKTVLTLLLTLYGAAALADPPLTGPRCDLNQDGRSDLMVFQSHVGGRGHNQQHINWGIGGEGLASVGNFSVPYNGDETLDWRVLDMDDFDGNGICDLFWERDGQIWVTLTPPGGPMMAPFPGDWPSYPGPGPGWSLAGSGDFDGDGRADKLWWNAGSRKLRVWVSDAGAMTYEEKDLEAAAPPLPWDAVAVGLAGGGATGILWRSADTGALLHWRVVNFELQTAGPVLFATELVGRTWRVAAVGDFNGDGYDDLVWQEPVSEDGMRGGKVVVWFMRGTAQLGETLLSPSVLVLYPNDPPGLIRGPR
jgi:FG-GAP repeat